MGPSGLSFKLEDLITGKLGPQNARSPEALRPTVWEGVLYSPYRTVIKKQYVYYPLGFYMNKLKKKKKNKGACRVCQKPRLMD